MGEEAEPATSFRGMFGKDCEYNLQLAASRAAGQGGRGRSMVGDVGFIRARLQRARVAHHPPSHRRPHRARAAVPFCQLSWLACSRRCRAAPCVWGRRRGCAPTMP